MSATKTIEVLSSLQEMLEYCLTLPESVIKQSMVNYFKKEIETLSDDKLHCVDIRISRAKWERIKDLV